ncbi:MAG TPA: substrate-binding domain-containing protein [Candidatus Hydrogenedentes bacterium]|nr:substrate-binding domain-containing protein [Candidatus Hydrogenedentota bacterium]HPG69611.1 substrate-binding domain-containing protein [Candidatus Hydrogenedentota bacterium]
MRSVWLIVFGVAVASGGCGGPEPSGGEPAKDGARVVGASLLTQTHVFYQKMVSAMEAEAAVQGFELRVQYAEFDLRKQNDQMEMFITQGVDAIILSPVESAGVTSVVAEARAAGIPVFTADIAAHGADVVSHIASDNHQGGVLIGEYLAKLLGGKGDVAIIDHPSVESVQQRTAGFVQALERYPDMRIVQRVPGEGQRDKALKAAQDLLEASADLKGIFGINDDSALGALAAVEEAGLDDRIVIVGFDGTDEALKAIQRGSALKADTAQFPEAIGQTTIQAVAAYLRGEEVPANVPVKVEVLDKARLDAEQ